MPIFGISPLETFAASVTWSNLEVTLNDAGRGQSTIHVRALWSSLRFPWGGGLCSLTLDDNLGQEEVMEHAVPMKDGEELDETVSTWNCLL